MKTLITIILTTTVTFSSSYAGNSGKVRFNIGKSDSLESLVSHVELDTNSSISFNPPQSTGFHTGYKVADKMFSLGLTTFLNLSDKTHPFPKLSAIPSIEVLSSSSSTKLEDQIAGFNHYMWSKAIKKLGLSRALTKQESDKLQKEVDEAWNMEIPNHTP